MTSSPTRIYVDHNATSPPRPAVRERLSASIAAPYANPSSVHVEGQRSRRVIEAARRAVTESIGPGGRVVFTSGATEANHLAMLGAPGHGAIATSRIEHPSVIALAQRLESEGRAVRWLRHDERGRVALDDLDAALREGVGYVALMAANNELGNLNPIGGAAELCAAAGVPLHVDAAQVVGRWHWRAVEGICSVTASAHKAGGPLGVGALWLAEGYDVAAQLVGGRQQRGARGGTEVTWLADAWAAVFGPGGAGAWELTGQVRDAFEETLRVGCDVEVNGDVDARLPNTSNLAFAGCEGEELVMALDLEGIAVSSGSACTAGSVEPSAVLLALGQGAERARSAVRFSFGPEHTVDDGAALGARVAEVARRVAAA
jgi:cysteine desulfurase